MLSMQNVKSRSMRLAAEEEAVTATEYAILLSLLILVCVVAIGGIGGRVINLYSAIDEAMPEGF